MSYTFLTLDFPSATFTSDSGINDNGTIVGTFVLNNLPGGFVYSNGTYTSMVADFGPIPPGTGREFGYSIHTAEDINNAGRIVGTGEYQFGQFGHITDGYAMESAQSPPSRIEFPGSNASTYAYGINTLGQIVGWYTNNSNPHGFIFNNGTYTSFEHPLAHSGSTSFGTWAQDINDNGQIVGYYLDSQNRTHGFQYNIFSGGSFTTIDAPGGSGSTFATDINNLGQIVGYYFDGAGISHGFLLAGGTYTTIDDPFGPGGTALYGINNLGQLVGKFTDSSGVTHGLIAQDTSVNHPPVIASNGGGDAATLSFVENSTALLTTITASDPDIGQTVTYAIVGGADGALFQLNGSSGALSFIDVPDFESPSDNDFNNSYVVQVAASDGSLTDTQTITVNVTNVSDPGQSLSGDASSNNLAGGNGGDTLDGGDGNDTLAGGLGADVIFAGAGDDNASGGAGNDIILGQDGNDTIGGDTGADRINGGAGNDVIFGGSGNDELGGGAGNDTIVGQDGDDVIFGEDGVDVANGGTGNDVMLGGLGNDTFGGGSGTDVLIGGDGDDLLFGEDGADNINGEFGNDGVVGGSGDDTLGGGAGNDIIVGDDGNDVLFGETGNDAMNGGFGNDILIGSEGDDVLGGGAGDDDLNGGFGNDTLFGENGNDILNGSAGNDILIGGGNDDTFVFQPGDGADTIGDFFAGGLEDRIWFKGTDLHSFADVQAHLTFNAAAGTATITYNGFFTVTLNGITAGQLTVGDFIFT